MYGSENIAWPTARITVTSLLTEQVLASRAGIQPHPTTPPNQVPLGQCKPEPPSMAALTRRPTTCVCPNSLLVRSAPWVRVLPTPRSAHLLCADNTPSALLGIPGWALTSPRCSQVLQSPLATKHRFIGEVLAHRVILRDPFKVVVPPSTPQSTPTSGRKLQGGGEGWAASTTLPLPTSGT